MFLIQLHPWLRFVETQSSKGKINGGLAPDKREEERIKGWTVDIATQTGEGQGIRPKISRGGHWHDRMAHFIDVIIRDIIILIEF